MDRGNAGTQTCNCFRIYCSNHLTRGWFMCPCCSRLSLSNHQMDSLFHAVGEQTWKIRRWKLGRLLISQVRVTAFYWTGTGKSASLLALSVCVNYGTKPGSYQVVSKLLPIRPWPMWGNVRGIRGLMMEQTMGWWTIFHFFLAKQSLEN